MIERNVYYYPNNEFLSFKSFKYEGKRDLKIKIYKKTDYIEHLLAEFLKLKKQKYTHILYMPYSDFTEILEMSKLFKIVVIDSRSVKHIINKNKIQ